MGKAKPGKEKNVLGILAKAGYPSEAVDNGLEVLASLEGNIYGVILMDVQLPRVDVLQTTSVIRGKERDGMEPQFLRASGPASPTRQ
jgi:CheY-like chemotaxis protein